MKKGLTLELIFEKEKSMHGFFFNPMKVAFFPREGNQTMILSHQCGCVYYTVLIGMCEDVLFLIKLERIFFKNQGP